MPPAKAWSAPILISTFLIGSFTTPYNFSPGTPIWGVRTNEPSSSTLSHLALIQLSTKSECIARVVAIPEISVSSSVVTESALNICIDSLNMSATASRPFSFCLAGSFAPSASFPVGFPVFGSTAKYPILTQSESTPFTHRSRAMVISVPSFIPFLLSNPVSFKTWSSIASMSSITFRRIPLCSNGMSFSSGFRPVNNIFIFSADLAVPSSFTKSSQSPIALAIAPSVPIFLSFASLISLRVVPPSGKYGPIEL